eukprot:7274554-Prymnesium_polylepis.3
MAVWLVVMSRLECVLHTAKFAARLLGLLSSLSCTRHPRRAARNTQSGSASTRQTYTVSILYAALARRLPPRPPPPRALALHPPARAAPPCGELHRRAAVRPRGVRHGQHAEHAGVRWPGRAQGAAHGLDLARQGAA